MKLRISYCNPHPPKKTLQFKSINSPGELLNCSEIVPWHIIPSDQNWYKEYLIAKKVVETLEGFKMKFPGMKEAEAIQL